MVYSIKSIFRNLGSMVHFYKRRNEEAGKHGSTQINACLGTWEAWFNSGKMELGSSLWDNSRSVKYTRRKFVYYVYIYKMLSCRRV
jgi:hypothetical protein